jgi:hypothetical protein
MFRETFGALYSSARRKSNRPESLRAWAARWSAATVEGAGASARAAV